MGIEQRNDIETFTIDMEMKPGPCIGNFVSPGSLKCLHYKSPSQRDSLPFIMDDVSSNIKPNASLDKQEKGHPRSPPLISDKVFERPPTVQLILAYLNISNSRTDAHYLHFIFCTQLTEIAF